MLYIKYYSPIYRPAHASVRRGVRRNHDWGIEMMNLRTAAFLLFLLSLLPVQFRVFAADSEVEKDFRREIALYHIRPDASRSLKKDSDGLPVSESRYRQGVEDFYNRLYPLTPSFLKRLKLKNVIFKDTLYDRDGNVAQRRLAGDDLFLDVDISEETFLTSVFLLQFMFISHADVVKWEKLNPDAFSYENNRGTVKGRAKQKLDEILAEWDHYFVSRLAMYSPEMDMAQTFTYLIRKGPASAVLTGEDRPVIQKKVKQVCDLLVSIKAFDSGYMDTLLAIDLNTLKKYSQEALSIRLYHEYSRLWSVPQPKPAADPADAGKGGTEKAPAGASKGGTEKTSAPAAVQFAPPRKIGEDVEVAGAKVNPLILALTVNDMKLFRLLIENKVDPNVSKNGVSALQLAIRNNDPEQVQMLLTAGAKVTLEIARAGTASGVRPEIVKLMTPFLPGVKQMDEPPPKQERKNAGAWERGR